MNRLDKLTILREINSQGDDFSEHSYATCLVGRAAKDSRFVAEGARSMLELIPLMDGFYDGSGEWPIQESFARFFGVTHDEARHLTSKLAPEDKAVRIEELIAGEERAKAERKAAFVAQLAALTEPPAVDGPAPEETAHERATLSRAVRRAGRAVSRVLSRAG